MEVISVRGLRIWLSVALLVALLPVAVYAAFVGTAAKAEIAFEISARAAAVVSIATFAGAVVFFLLPDIGRLWKCRRRSLA